MDFWISSLTWNKCPEQGYLRFKAWDMDDRGQKGDREGSKLVAHARFNSVRIGTRTQDLDVDLESWDSLFQRGFLFVLISWRWIIILDVSSDCTMRAGAV